MFAAAIHAAIPVNTIFPGSGVSINSVGAAKWSLSWGDTLGKSYVYMDASVLGIPAGAKYLSFTVTGNQGGENFNVNIQDADGFHFISLDGYCAISDVSQSVNLPFADFGIKDASKISRIYFEGFAPDRGGSVIIQNPVIITSASFTPAPIAASELESVEHFHESGVIARKDVPKKFDKTKKAKTLFSALAAAPPVPPPANVVTVLDNGPYANRYLFTTVGDGYQSTQMALYHTHVGNVWNYLKTISPIKEYLTYFNVYSVEVISADSGVDNDPLGVYKNTTLNMYFNCSSIDRLLCMDTGTAASYAANAPGYNQVIGIANSTKYGGAGYTGSNMCTASGGNGSSPQVAIHELGHSMAVLADEYEYTTGTYTGGEKSPSPSTVDRNVSIYTKANQIAMSTKWYQWMGLATPDGGLIDTFEGADDGAYGLYRPSNASMMRVLKDYFNLVGREAMVLGIYKKVKPIDSCTSTAVTLNCADTINVTPMRPVDHALNISWFLDNVAIPGTDDLENLDLSTVAIGGGAHVIKARVVDNTAFVKDSYYRDMYLTQEKSWNVNCVVTTKTITPTMTKTATPTVTRTASKTATQTATKTNTASATATNTETVTQTAVISPSNTPTATPTDTDTPAYSPTYTQTITPSFTQTATMTATASATKTITQTAVASATFTPTFTLTNTATPTITRTMLPVTLTVTHTNTATITPTGTLPPTATITPTLSPAEEVTGVGIVNIYPNPAKDSVAVKYVTQAEEAQAGISIYTVSYRLVGKRDCYTPGKGGHSVILELPGFANGIYYLVYTENNKMKGKIKVLIVLK